HRSIEGWGCSQSDRLRIAENKRTAGCGVVLIPWTPLAVWIDMAFLNPLFLLGALAAGIPVLVHLVRRTRAIKLPFASLMFLRRIEQKTIRKRKLRNL